MPSAYPDRAILAACSGTDHTIPIASAARGSVQSGFNDVALDVRGVLCVARPHRSLQIPFDRDHPIRSILIIHSGGSRSSIQVIPIIPEMTALNGCR
jgi:hypothetical protein